MNDISSTNECNGYVNLKKENDEIFYIPYINCGSEYITTNFDEYYINLLSSLSVDILVVAGGGGGGYRHGGGGGAGGLLYEENRILNMGTVYNTKVGSGGSGSVSSGMRPCNGEDSFFDNIVANGGGGAGQWDNYKTASSGGSGGGSTILYNAAATQGNIGGTSYAATSPYNHGGGGGAGSPGGNGTNVSHGSGGIGMYYGDKFSNNYGENGWFAGGGGGGGHDPAALNQGLGGNGGGGNGGMPGIYMNGENALINTGGGGGGASTPASGYNFGGNGGSGIVLIRYLGKQKANGGIVTEYNGYTIHAFLSGTDTFEILNI